MDDQTVSDPATVGSKAALFGFYRDVPELVSCSEENYILHAKRSFPNIAFKPEIAREFKNFSENYTKIRPKMDRVLAVLNDLLATIRHECHQDSGKIQKALSSEAQLEVSPESPNTHKNKKAMKEREAIFGGQSVCCEWHVKFQPNTDRMHFHFGIPSIANGKILVCHFTQHMST